MSNEIQRLGYAVSGQLSMREVNGKQEIFLPWAGWVPNEAPDIEKLKKTHHVFSTES